MVSDSRDANRPLELLRSVQGKSDFNDKRTTKRGRIAVPEHSQCINPKKIQKRADFFAGIEMCVISGDTGSDKKALETLIVAHGGRVLQVPLASTHCVIVGKQSTFYLMVC
jgi:hypothetical protein